MLTGKLNIAGLVSMLLVLAAETGGDGWSFLSDLTTRAPLNYICFSLIGLYSSITFVCVEEKRWPKGYDFMKLIGYIPFVWGLALLFGTSPLISLMIGIAPEPTFKYLRRRARKWLEKQFRDDGGDGDSEGASSDDDRGNESKEKPPTLKGN
jgi:hypothetical protein